MEDAKMDNHKYQITSGYRDQTTQRQLRNDLSMPQPCRTTIFRGHIQRFGSVSALLVAVCLLGTTARSEAREYDRHVLVVNNTPYTMTYFYASNVDRQVWEEDVLGSHVLEP